MTRRSTTKAPHAKKSEREGGSELSPRLPKDEHEEELIDEALTETFPASDPVAIPTPPDQKGK